MKKITSIAQIIWSLCGVLMILVLILAINIGMDAKVVVEDMRYTAEKRLYDERLSLTATSWGAFMDFCERNGFITSEDNWQKYRYGQLIPQRR